MKLIIVCALKAFEETILFTPYAQIPKISKTLEHCEKHLAWKCFYALKK